MIWGRTLLLFDCLMVLMIFANCGAPVTPTNTGAIANESAQKSDVLIQSVTKGDVGAVRRSLAEGASLEATDRDGYTPLMIATIKGDKEILRILLDAGANINATNHAGYTALKMAIEA